MTPRVRQTQPLSQVANSAAKAHERIDSLHPIVAVLAEQMTQSIKSIDKMSAQVESTARDMQAHVAECKLVRDALKDDKAENKGRFDWALQGVVIGLCVVVWEVVKHFTGLG